MRSPRLGDDCGSEKDAQETRFSSTIDPVHLWRVTEDPKTRLHRHVLPDRFGHALLAPVVGHVFEALGVSATIWDGRHWWSIHAEPSVSEFEHEHRVDTERIDYNERHLAQAQRQRKVVRGEL